RDRAENNFQLALDNNIAVTHLAEQLKPIAGTQSATVEKILDLAGRNYDRMLKGVGESVPLLEGKARMLNSFSDLYIDLGNTSRALACAEEARALFQRLCDRDQDALRWQAGLATSLERAGAALAWQGKLVPALTAFRQSLALREELVRRDRDNPEWQM